MFRFCNCDGINASRKLSKSCRVNAGGGLGCEGVAAAFAGGGVGSEINGEGDGAGPCANAANGVPAKINKTMSFCTAANVPVARLMTRLCFCCERRLNRLDPLLQFFKMGAGPVNLAAPRAAPELIIIDLRERLELANHLSFVGGLERSIAAQTTTECR